MQPEQVEASQQTPQDSTEGVAPVEEPEPRHTFRCGLDPSGDRGEGGPHHNRGRK